MRLFVAMDIPEAVRHSMAKLRAQFEKVSRGARWVRMEGVHLTLKFIGEVPDERAAEICAALDAVPPRAPIELRFAGLGFFPNERRPRVFWAGIDGGAALRELAAELETRLGMLGIAREDREFHPHLTLARFDSQGAANLEALRAAARESGASEFGRAQADEFHLYQSVLKSAGAEYTRLATYRLCGRLGKSPLPVSPETGI